MEKKFMGIAISLAAVSALAVAPSIALAAEAGAETPMEAQAVEDAAPEKAPLATAGEAPGGVIEGDGWTLDSKGVFTLVKDTADALGGYQHPWIPYGDKIREVVVAEGVTQVPVGAFSNREGGYFKNIYPNLSRVTLASSVRVVRAGAFSDLKGLKEVKLNEGLERIDASAFTASGLTSIELPSGVELGSDIFTYCKDLSGTLVIPAGTKWGGNAQFYGCEGLEAVIVEEGQTSIANQMLGGCTGLKYVKLPKSLVQFGDSDVEAGVWDSPVYAPLIIGYSGSMSERYVGHWTSTGADWAQGMAFHAVDGNDHACGEWSTVKEPACDVAGVEEGICSICGANCRRETPALGHSWGEGVVTTEATASAEGVKTFTCGRCGVTRTEAIAKLDQGPSMANGGKAESAEGGLPATGDPVAALGLLTASGAVIAAAGEVLRRRR